MSERKRILFTTIFRPFSRPGKYNLAGDEKFLDYFSNRLTREPGMFPLHDNHPTVAPHLIASNLDADVVVLETPTIEEFKEELAKNYDYLCITFLTLHFPKLVHMVAWARKIAPDTKIVIGGFGTALYDLDRLEVDAICQEEGIGFMRKLLGQDPQDPVTHPVIAFDIGLRIGVQQPGLPRKRVGILVNGFGCPHACEFCSTSAYFGRKHVPLIRTGQDLLETMARYDREAGIRDFIIYEEDFFLYKRQIEDFLAAARQHPTLFSYGCYSTIKSFSRYDIEDLVESGLSHAWIGVESLASPFSKSEGRPIQDVFAELQRYGVTTTGSIIAGLDHHAKDNLPLEFEHLASLFPSTVQISNLIAGPGTPLRERLAQEKRLFEDVRLHDSHLYSEHVMHPEFGRGELREFIFQGYDHIYNRIGPALYRIMKTWFQGACNLRSSPRERLRARGELLAHRAGALRPVFLATMDHLPNQDVRQKVETCLDDMAQELGAPNENDWALAHRFLAAFESEAKRRASEGDHVYEPPTGRTEYSARTRVASDKAHAGMPLVGGHTFDVHVERLRRI
jgi:haloalkane dehalogenase